MKEPSSDGKAGAEADQSDSFEHLVSNCIQQIEQMKAELAINALAGAHEGIQFKATGV